MENADKIKIGDLTIPVAFRNSRQAKRISLRISAARNSVIITLPKRSSTASGIKFLNSKASWLLANLELSSSIPLLECTSISIFGKYYMIKRMEGRGVTRLTDYNLEVHCLPEFISRRVKDFLKKLMREQCLRRGMELAQRIDKVITKMTVNEATSRWGSCNADGAISLNWLLVFAPANVLNYVIAHEVSHLKEMNHSPKFWNIVEQLAPDMISARKWLKTEGYKLHRYE